MPLPQSKAAGQVRSYSHILSPIHRKNGYTLTAATAYTFEGHMGKQASLNLILRHHGREAGWIRFYVAHRKGITAVMPYDSYLDVQHRGKGLGFRMYEALAAHGKAEGGTHMVGSAHTEHADRMHKRLSEKYGFNYRSKQLKRPTVLDFNPQVGEKIPLKYGAYKYPLKEKK